MTMHMQNTILIYKFQKTLLLIDYCAFFVRNNLIGYLENSWFRDFIFVNICREQVKGYVGGYGNGYGHRFGYNPYAHVYHHQHRQPYLFKTRSKLLCQFYQLLFHLWPTMVFCYQNCSDLLWEKIVLVIEQNFWNLRLKAGNLPNFWEQ